MIVVRSIAGESYNLVTGKQQQKALVLSNGNSEVLVPVDDDTVERVLRLLVTSPESEAPEAPEVQATFDEEDPTPSPAETNNRKLYVAGRGEQVLVKATAYDDPESGTASI